MSVIYENKKLGVVFLDSNGELLEDVILKSYIPG